MGRWLAVRLGSSAVIAVVDVHREEQRPCRGDFASRGRKSSAPQVATGICHGAAENRARIWEFRRAAGGGDRSFRRRATLTRPEAVAPQPVQRRPLDLTDAFPTDPESRCHLFERVLTAGVDPVSQYRALAADAPSET